MTFKQIPFSHACLTCETQIFYEDTAYWNLPLQCEDCGDDLECYELEEEEK